MRTAKRCKPPVPTWPKPTPPSAPVGPNLQPRARPPRKAVGLLAAGSNCVAAKAIQAASTSDAARSPERIAPSTQPHMVAELSVPAQWMRPHGGRRV